MTRSFFSRTLPLWSVHGGMCTCGQTDSQGNPCRRAGKHPKWYEDGTEDDADGYVVVTGQAPEGSGVFVLDVDVKGGTDGYAQLKALCAGDRGELPKTLTVRTPSGGAHFYFRHPGFHVGQHKPASAIDIKGDKREADGLVYVVGPGSPGASGGAYEVVCDATIADAPEWLLAWLRIGSTNRTKEGAFTPTSIDDTHPAWKDRVDAGAEACRTMPPSKADGEGGKNLFALCLKLVRTLELPVGVALEQIKEWFNPRCTDPSGNVYPWDDSDILHKLEDARDRSAMPCGPPPLELRDVIAKHADRSRSVQVPAESTPVDERRKVTADDSYGAERSKITRADAVQILYSWPDWKGVLWYDTLKRRPFCIAPPVVGKMTLEDGQLSKGDLAQIAHWFDVHGFLASKELVDDALWTVVRQPDRQVNRIVHYLDALPKAESASLLATLATDVLGAVDPFANTLVAKTLVAAVRRARDPGHRHRAMLVLKGEQYCGKTAFVRIMAGDWYHTTGNGNLADRDTKLECAGNWLVEVEELSAMNKADADALKTAISVSADVITKKYEPDAQTYPRSFVFIGTTNKDEFLTDSTGNTRYWIVEVGRVDIARLEALRDQIWAEADWLARNSDADSNELKDEESQRANASRNEAYVNTHPWIEHVARFVAGKTEVRTTAEVLEFITGGDKTKQDKRAKNEVADAMRMLGCRPRTRRVGSKTERIWEIPADVSERAQAAVPSKLRAVK